MDPETRKIVKERGISVWMRAEFDVLLRRVSRRDNRPLLKGNDKEEVLRRLIEERYPVYGEADITVQSQDGPHEETVSEVIEAIKQFLQNEPRAGNRATSPSAAH